MKDRLFILQEMWPPNEAQIDPIGINQCGRFANQCKRQILNFVKGITRFLNDHSISTNLPPMGVLICKIVVGTPQSIPTQNTKAKHQIKLQAHGVDVFGAYLLRDPILLAKLGQCFRHL